MRQRTLGSTDLKVSVVGVGTWQFGGEWGHNYSQTEVDAIFDAARDTGINLIDTAECYGDHLAEKFVGEAIKQDRSKWILATKFGHKFHENFERDVRIQPTAVIEQLDDSLRALQTDYVDLYQFHSLPDDDFETEKLWTTLKEEQRKGKIRHLGISIGSKENIFQTEQSSTIGSEVIQVIYNRLERECEEKVLPACKKLNLGVLARVPLASGYLSGKYKKGDQFPDNDVRGKWHTEEMRNKNIEEALKIQAEEVPAGIDMAQWALAWCLKNEVITAVIPGCKNPDQVRSNAGASNLIDG